MNSSSYDSLKKEEVEMEIERLKVQLSSLETQACEVIKELLAEIEKKKTKTKSRKKKTENHG